MKTSSTYFLFIIFASFIALSFITGGCAQIGMPSGGIKDSLPPVLEKATPELNARNVKTNKITLEFNEYIDVQEIANNVLVSPAQNKMPVIIANPKSIVVRFRDSMLPNTTYHINFGNAIRDINENNVAKDFSYTFSTGSTIDSLGLFGKVTLAENGTADSNMIVMLYRNLVDTAVQKFKPDYIAKVKGNGSFYFTNLPAENFKIYALRDKDGSKTYNGKAELFAFNSQPVNPATAKDSIELLAFADEKEADNRLPVPVKKPELAKKLTYTTTASPRQDLLGPAIITFNNPLKEADTTGIYITDTLFNKIAGVRYELDSTSRKLSLNYKWQPETNLRLIIENDAVADSAGTELSKTDTIRFVTKAKEEYATIVLRFTGLDLRLNPRLQFVQGDNVIMSYPLTGTQWSNDLFPPGEYGIRILYDEDKNGVWTTGNYLKKQQPEVVTALPQKLSVRANWDNEREINL
jgi:hypothetical protein